MAKETLNAVVTQKIEVTPELVVLQVSPDGWELPEFTAGQFVVLGLPGSAPRVAWADPEDEPADPDKLIRRAYSIASGSVDRDHLEFYITVVHSGALTPRLFALETGDRVWLGPKITGMFTLNDVPEGKDVVLVATGTGLAPFMSMLRTYLSEQNDRRFAVLHGSRHSWDLGYRTELFTMQRLCDHLVYLPIISRPDEEPVAWPGRSGYVQSLWTDGALDEAWGEHPTPENTHVLLCGNPKMCEDMVSLLEGEGFIEHKRRQPGQIHVERYW